MKHLASVRKKRTTKFNFSTPIVINFSFDLTWDADEQVVIANDSSVRLTWPPDNPRRRTPDFEVGALGREALAILLPEMKKFYAAHCVPRRWVSVARFRGPKGMYEVELLPTDGTGSADPDSIVPDSDWLCWDGWRWQMGSHKHEAVSRVLVSKRTGGPA